MTLTEKLNHIRVEIAIERAKVNLEQILASYTRMVRNKVLIEQYHRRRKAIDGLKRQAGVS